MTNIVGAVSGVAIRKDAKQFELWEKSTSSLLGLINAIEEYLQFEGETISNTISSKARRIRDHISESANLVLIGQKGSQSGIASFYLKGGRNESEIIERFNKSGMIFSVICDWDCPLFFPKGVQSILRFSPHYFTPDNDIDELCKLIDQV